MSNAIPVGDWLNVLENEYLSTFIREGGASVKFAVPPEELKPRLSEDMKARCRDLDYVFVKINAEDMRAHMPQDFFFSLAKQIDWRLLARKMVLRMAADMGFRVEGIAPAAAGDLFESIAEASGVEASFARMELRPELYKIPQNPQMARDFRIAMTHLCLDGGQQNHPIVDWLTGVNTRLSNVRMYQIHTPINRNTARHFIESAFYWVHHVGYSGTVIFLDNSRVTLARRPKPSDGKRYYTRAMTMEHYEMLREFIDGLDKLVGALLVVVSNQDFLNESADRGSRGYGIYQALRTRIMDDVRDRNLVNPVASLVRLSEQWTDNEEEPGSYSLASCDSDEPMSENWHEEGMETLPW